MSNKNIYVLSLLTIQVLFVFGLWVSGVEFERDSTALNIYLAWLGVNALGPFLPLAVKKILDEDKE